MTVNIIYVCAKYGGAEFLYSPHGYECTNCGTVSDTRELVPKVLEVYELSEYGLNRMYKTERSINNETDVCA